MVTGRYLYQFLTVDNRGDVPAEQVLGHDQVEVCGHLRLRVRAPARPYDSLYKGRVVLSPAEVVEVAPQPGER
jgi:hypothetical protein